MWPPSEGLVGILVGVAAIVVAIVIAAAQRRPKLLAWDVVVDEPLRLRSEQMPASLKITWDGKVVNALRLSTIRIENLGRRVVLPGDFLDPIAIELAEGAFLDIQVRDASKGVSPEIPAKPPLPNRLEFIPPALNPREWFELRFVIDGAAGFSASCRIAEQSRPFRRQQLPGASRRIKRYFLGWGTLALVIGGSTAGLGSSINQPWLVVLGALVSYLSFGFVLSALIPDWFTRALFEARRRRREARRGVRSPAEGSARRT
jgi:hypothetical protein